MRICLSLLALGCVGVCACGGSAPGTPAGGVPTAPSCTFTVSTVPTTFGAAGGSGSATVAASSSSCAWAAASRADWIKVDTSSHSGNGSVAFTVDSSPQADKRSGVLTVAGQTLSISQDGVQTPPASCVYSLTADVTAFAREGSTGTLRITTGSACSWSITEDLSWVGIETPLQGTGSAVRGVSAVANTTAAERRATITVADQKVSFSQPGQDSCRYQVGPVQFYLARVTATGTASIATEPGCAWTVSSDSSWLHAQANGGQGTGTAPFAVDFNAGGQRSATLPIRWAAPTAGQNVHLTQEGDCNIGIFPSPSHPAPGYSGGRIGTLTVPPEGGKFSFELLSDPAFTCAWAVRSSVDWITLDRPGGSGDGGFSFVVAANASASPRQSAIDLNGQPFTIIQNGR